MTFSVGQAALHASAASVMAFGFSRLDTLHINDWMKTQYGGHFQFLTIQGLAVAWLTMIMGLMSNAFPSFRFFKDIKRALLIVALPLAVVISTIYWTLILLFPALIIQVPGSSESSSANLDMFRLPLYIDLALHASPALALLADFVLYETRFSTRTTSSIAPLSVLVFALWYATWAEYCAKNNGGIFPYPFLTHNTFEIRLAIYAGASILAYTSFLAINSLHPRPARSQE